VLAGSENAMFDCNILGEITNQAKNGILADHSYNRLGRLTTLEQASLPVGGASQSVRQGQCAHRENRMLLEKMGLHT
jgi:hypothetical protein